VKFVLLIGGWRDVIPFFAFDCGSYQGDISLRFGASGSTTAIEGKRM
jgi:hypothetical protein